MYSQNTIIFTIIYHIRLKSLCTKGVFLMFYLKLALALAMFCLAKENEAGVVKVWDKTYGGNDADCACATIQASDGGSL